MANLIHIQLIPRLIGALVTELALTMPIAYISNILFFNNKELVARCSWEPGEEAAEIIFSEFQPAYITFNKNYNNFTDVEVAAVDPEGNRITIRPGLATLRNSKF
jgi:hypothetical protein